MLYAIVTKADTSSNQAIKDPGQRRCGYSNLGKIVIKSVAAKRVAAKRVAVERVAATFVAEYGGSAGTSRFPTSSEPLTEQSKKWPCAS
jgi:hypothetical protein